MFLKYGFTLLEMLMALFITALLAMLMVPVGSHFYHASQSQIVREALWDGLDFALREANIKHQLIAICASQDQITCQHQANQALIIFIDNENDGVIHDKTQLLRVISLAHGTLYSRSFPITRQYIQISRPEEMTINNGTFWYCLPKVASPDWAIALSVTGEMRLQLPDKEGRIKDGHGKRLMC